MKEYRGPGGDRRLWYDADEIESIMADELRRAGLLPDPKQADLSVDIEAFVEIYLRLPFDLNAQLDPTVLGVTDFVPGKKPKISINRDLTGSALDEEDATPGMVGRWRATVAHEVCHVLLHRLLFEIDDLQRGLFPITERSGTPEQLLRCLKRDVGFNVQVSEWKEVQANKGMGALLMSKPAFLAAVEQAKAFLGADDRPIAAGSAMHDQLAALLARRFTVSRQAACIRLTTLRVVHPAHQPPLF